MKLEKRKGRGRTDHQFQAGMSKRMSYGKIYCSDVLFIQTSAFIPRMRFYSETVFTVRAGKNPPVRTHPRVYADTARPRGRTHSFLSPPLPYSVPSPTDTDADARKKIKIKNYFFIFGFQSPRSLRSPRSLNSPSSAGFVDEATRKRRFFQPSSPSHPSKLYSSLGWLNSKVPKPFSLWLIDVDGF
jgi:hypothetical protein